MLATVRINLPSGSLVGDYSPGGSHFAVVWVHGFGSHRGGEKSAALRAECERRGWPFAAFDFRCHGDSTGAMHELRGSGLLEDLAAIREFLRGRGHTRLGLVGSSMGGFASAWFAVQNPEPVVGCVFLAPGFVFVTRRWDRLTDAEREEWKRTGRLRVTSSWVDAELGYGFAEERDSFRPADLAARWNKPALIFHGLADDVVPASDSLDFLRNAAYPEVELRLLKSGDHRLTAHKDEIAAGACRFFARLLTS
jgi:pimeloyl-ACP methyl ester carboxylesterase